MFEDSSHAKYWIFKSSQDLRSERIKNSNKYITEHQNKMKINSSRVIQAEDEAIILKFYSKFIVAFIQPDIFALPNSTLAIGLTLLRRFYIVKSIMDYDPAEISLVCLYLATKIDEVHVSAITFISKCELIANNSNLQRSRLIKLELDVMNVINYDLTIYNPFTSLSGILTYATAVLSPDVAENIKHAYKEAENIIFQLLLTDCPLLYSHSLISFVALLLAVDREFGSGTKLLVMNKISDKLGLGSDIDLYFNEMRDMLDISESIQFEQIREILEKLKHCLNPDHVEFKIGTDTKKLKLLSDYLK